MTRSVPWWREPTRAQWASFGSVWLGWVLDAFDFTVLLLVMPQIMKEFGVGQTAVAGSITATLLARLLGGVLAGAVADRVGRKLPFLISVAWLALCDGAIALAPSYAWVLALRVVFGLGMGAEWTAGTALAMESWPARSRKIASGILQGSWAIGYLLAGVLAAWVVPAWGWRGLFAVAALPALIVFPLRLMVPESPEWESRRTQARSGLEDLLAADVLRGLAWASLAMSLGFGVYYGMTGLYATLLQKMLGASLTEVSRLVSLFNLGMLLGSIGTGWLAARRGVRVAVLVPALLALGVLPLYVGAVPAAIGTGAFLGGAVGVGFCGLVPSLLTDLFPAHVRARCMGITYHVGAFVAAFVPLLIASLWEHGRVSLQGAIVVVAGLGELGLVALFGLRGARQPAGATLPACSTTP